MYNHADQSWKKKPLVFSNHNQELFISRLKEYVAEVNLTQTLIIYHGGEPLIFGVDNMIAFAKKIRENLTPLNCRVDFGIQTNGTLLKREHLEALRAENITVSLSIDGPKEIHDYYRKDHKGKPSFDKAYKALNLLKEYPDIFTGCIAVINPIFSPRTLFKFVSDNEISEFNILLPDANYISPPKGKNLDKNLYKKWLIEAFDCWYYEFPHIQCKFFEFILLAILGHSGQTDSLGLGDISLLNIETDGSYHDLDVLKITEEDSSNLNMSLESNRISDAYQSPKIQLHRHLLSKKGLSDKCLNCKHLEVCGGGSVPHRFSKSGYKNPTIYCDEMFSLIDHIENTLANEVKKESHLQNLEQLEEFKEAEIKQFYTNNNSHKLIKKLQNHRFQKDFIRLKSICDYSLDAFPDRAEEIKVCKNWTLEEAKTALSIPTTHSWLRAMHGYLKKTIQRNANGEDLPCDPNVFSKLSKQDFEKPTFNGFIIQSNDPWYSYSVGENIVLNHPFDQFEQGLSNLEEALRIIKQYDPNLYSEIELVSPNIQIIKDRRADPEKDVSFSDETIPGALFIGVWKGQKLLNPLMVAASIIHEHFHQKLYLLQHAFTLFPEQETLIFSPWPNTYRPPAGAVHAVYVFTQVARFWNQMIKEEKEKNLSEDEFIQTMEKLNQCINEINENVIFTELGQLFFDCIFKDFQKLKQESSIQYATA